MKQSRPLVSVFTPSHRPTYLDDCYRSLKVQTYRNWEWVVLLNGGAEWTPPEHDPRVRVIYSSTATTLGGCKGEACAACTGDILVELDHDDRLLSSCLAEVVAAFRQHPDAGLIYSDYALMNDDGTPAGPVLESPPPTPNNVSWNVCAPNHVRAFRRSMYEAVGRFDSTTLHVEHDQMIRLYQAGEFYKIPRCLYLQRAHSANTSRTERYQRSIREETTERYWQVIGGMATSWARRRGLHVLNVKPDPDPDQPIMLDADDSSVGVIYASDVLPRTSDPKGFFRECYRALAPNGLLFTASTVGTFDRFASGGGGGWGRLHLIDVRTSPDASGCTEAVLVAAKHGALPENHYRKSE